MGTEMLPRLDMDMAIDLDNGRDIDPDVAATLSDFLTYTEHLPSTVVRSLSLIQTLNRKADTLQLLIHQLLTQYATLPHNTAADAPDPVRLRKDISHAYDALEKCKRMSAAEAVRLDDTVAKDGARLELVQKKLKALPLPPSRDATPEPGLTSSQLRRNAQSQQAADKRAAQHRTGSAPRVRSRKIMVPGEVLPPPNPDSPPPSPYSTSPSPPPRSPANPRARDRPHGRPPKTPKVPKPAQEPRDRAQKTPRVRMPGVGGTNAHSAVAGISTSNALMALTAPPPDAVPGSKWLPWKRLTEYEMATLRKRMKKNAIWVPSVAMKNRELKNLGRGVAAMEEAKAAAERSGQAFVDESSTDWTDPTRVHLTDAQQAETDAMLGPELLDDNTDAALINRGMRLNEAKKLKREKQKKEEAERLLQEQEQGGQLQPPQEQANKRKKSPSKAQSQPQRQTQASKPAPPPQPPLQPQPELPTEQPQPVQPRPSAQSPPPVQQPDTVSEPEPEPVPAPTPKAAPGAESEAAPEPKSKAVSEQKSKPEPKSKKQAKPKPAPEPEAVQRQKTPEGEVEAALEAPAPETAKKVEAVAPPEPATTRKRKRDATTPAPAAPPSDPVVESPDVLSLPRPGPQPKKLKLTVPAPPPPPADKPKITVSTRTATAAASQSSPTKPNTPALSSPRISARQRSQRSSAQPEPPAASAQAAAQTPAANTRASKAGPTTIILKHSATKAASAEPPIRRQSLRRGSNASLPGASNNTRSPAPSNASNAAEAKTEKRPTRNRRAPPKGILQTEPEGTKVIVGKPKKKKAQQSKDAKGETAVNSTEDEMIDPDEPRYCICGDVSHGSMIACDNQNVSSKQCLPPPPPFFSLMILTLHYSATRSGSMSNVSTWLNCPREEQNGIVRSAARSSSLGSTPMALCVESERSISAIISIWTLLCFDWDERRGLLLYDYDFFFFSDTQ